MIKSFFRDNQIHKSIVPLFDYLFLLRPTLFFVIWVMLSLGMASAQMSITEYPLWISDFDSQILFIFLGITLICSGTFIINQISDKLSDKKNNKLFLLNDHINIDFAESISRATSILGLFFLTIGNIMLVPFGILIHLFWGFIYNKPPFEWKKRPFLGILTNTVIGIILFIIGWLQKIGGFGFDITILIVAMTPYILCFSAVSLMTNIPDIRGDKSANAITFSVKYGRKLTSLIALLLVLIAFCISYYIQDPIASTASITSIPFFIFAFVRNLDKDVLRSIRYPIFLLNFFLFALYPWLIVAVTIVYYLSKYYYWHRFNIHYPTFLVDD
mgnify:CR=1 FL=1